MEPRWTTVAEIRLPIGAAAVRLDDFGSALIHLWRRRRLMAFHLTVAQPSIWRRLKGDGRGLFLSVFALIARLKWTQLICNILAACLLRRDELSSHEMPVRNWQMAAKNKRRLQSDDIYEALHLPFCFFVFFNKASWDDWRLSSGPGAIHIREQAASGQYYYFFLPLSITVSAPAAIFAKLFVWITLMFSVSCFVASPCG